MKENKKSLQSGNDVPPVGINRQAKVDAIKQAVEAGTYRVDDRALAGSLLSELLWEYWERIRFIKP